EPPGPPFVAPVPERASWTVTADFPKTDTGKPAASAWSEKKVHTIRTGDILQKEIRYVNDSTSTQWLVNHMLLRESEGAGVTVSDVSVPQAADTLKQAWQYPGVAWVQADFFKGTVDFKKQKCNHYASGRQEAWINAKTKRPVAYQENGILYEFSFQPVPTDTLILPKKFQASLDRALRLINRRKQLAEDLRR
ncbi:MAG: hypothetical protein ACK5NG_09770, partial [Chthoniobacterales bacterium]